jgi:hypothetical protein
MEQSSPDDQASQTQALLEAVKALTLEVTYLKSQIHSKAPEVPVVVTNTPSEASPVGNIVFMEYPLHLTR